MLIAACSSILKIAAQIASSEDKKRYVFQLKLNFNKDLLLLML